TSSRAAARSEHPDPPRPILRTCVSRLPVRQCRHACSEGAVVSAAMSSDSPPLGVTFASFMNLGMPAALHAARRAEELGYSSFWTAETVGAEAFATLAAAGAAAPSLDLGTGVLALQL